MLRFDPQANFVPDEEMPPDPVESNGHPLMIGVLALVATVGGALGIWFWLSSGAGPAEAIANYVPPAFKSQGDAAPVSMAGIAPASTFARWAEQAGDAAEDRFPRINNDAYRRGLSAIAVGDNRGAVAHLQEAVRMDPEHADAHYKLGLAYMRVRNRDGARREKAVLEILDPNLASLLGNLVQ
jgi:tetratricopeptide (TPR) repeat protein